MNLASIHETSTEPEFEMAPLVDIAFLLLVFFLATSTLQKREQEIQMELPGVSSGVPKTLTQLSISVLSTGAVAVAGEIVEPAEGGRTMEQLTARLIDYEKLSRLAGTPPAIKISIKNGATQQRFVDVLNALATTEIRNVLLSDA